MAKPAPQTLPSSTQTALFERNLPWLLMAASAIILLVLAWPIFSGRFYTYDDLQNSNLPMDYSYWKALHDGDSFLWSPQYYCGAYIHGEGEGGMCHPLHWLQYRLLPMATAFGLDFLLSYVALFFGTFFFFRHLKLEKSASLFGAIIFSFAGFNLWHYMHLAPMAAIAHLPWLLVSNDKILCSTDHKQRVRAQLVSLLLTASQCLRGHPQFMWFCIIAECAFALVRVRSWVNWRRPFLLFTAKGLGLVIGAIQFLPQLDMVSTTNRSDSSFDFRMSFSMHPLNLTQLVSPLALLERYYSDWRWGNGNTHEMGLYAGAFCTLVIPWLAIRWKHLGKERTFLLITCLLGLFALVLSLGKYGHVYPVFSQLPVIKSLAFRAPTRFIFHFHLALAILSAFAFADLLKLLREGGKATVKSLWPLAIPLALSVGTYFWVMHVRGEPGNPMNARFASVDEAFMGVALIGAGVALLALIARGTRVAAYGIVILVFVEIAVWGLHDHIIRRGPPKTVQEVVASIGQLPPKEGRLFWPLANSIPVVEGYRLTIGNIGLIPAKKLPVDITSLRLADARYALMQNGWGQVPQPMPRARLLSQIVVSENVTQAVQQVNIATTGVVEKPVDVVPGEPGKAQITTDRPGRIDIKTTAPTRQLLVLSESYHSGWKARVDGKELPVIRAYGDFMGAVVDPGEKTVEWRFEPESFYRGARITFAGLAVALLWIVACWFIKPKQQVPAAAGAA